MDQQLNVYAWLARNALGWKILGARVQGFLDGWSALQAQRDPQMPQTKAPTYTVPLWDDDAVNRWITSRILELREQLPRADRDLVPCSPAERWEKPTTWAVKKKGNKHAMRNGAGYLDRAEAEAFAASQSVPTEIEFRPGERARCERFCSVRPWCSLYRVKGGLK